MTVTLNFIQPYGNYLLTGGFTGSDSDGDKVIIKDELTDFNLFFNHGENPIFQNLSNLLDFSYTVGADTVTKIASSSADVLDNGTVERISYDVNAVTPSLLAGQSSIAVTTHYSDGRAVEDSAFSSTERISISEIIPLNTVPEGSNVIALIVVGGTVLTLKKWRE